MRALLVINPQATGVSRAVTSIVTRVLQAELEIDLVETDARGHGVASARNLLLAATPPPSNR